jgi:hypothetical protein
MRKVELFELIRKDHEFGLSIRAISRKRGIHRRMVRQALTSPVPPPRKKPQRRLPGHDRRGQGVDRRLSF